MNIRPVFLLSVPRSGSTLLQRLLATHPAIATVSEPWILLPLLSQLNERGIYAPYAHNVAVRALDDFAAELPNGKDDLRLALRRFALDLYSRVARSDARYFLDKTPRYHLVIDELIRTFPDAKFIFLWRNPLAVLSSITRTWTRNRWYPYHYTLDLYYGLPNLLRCRAELGDDAVSVAYEDLVADPENTMRAVFGYLELDLPRGAGRSLSQVPLRGRMGDRVGTHAYSDVTDEPLTKWASTLNTPLRKRASRAYLAWLGRERLAQMGYDMGETLAALEAVPPVYRGLVRDVAGVVRGAPRQLVKYRLVGLDRRGSWPWF